MIEITLKGEDALQYIQNEKIVDARVVDLLETIEKQRKEIEQLKSAEMPTASAKVKEDSKKLSNKSGKILFSHRDTTPVEEPEVVEELPVKYKSRLSKKDRQELDAIANEKFRSNAKLDQFALKRNLRTSTVKTYIEKHSEGKYKLIKGTDIKSYMIWPNAVIEAESLYIAKA